MSGTYKGSKDPTDKHNEKRTTMETTKTEEEERMTILLVGNNKI